LRGYIAKLELRQQAGDIRGILQQAGEQPELAAILIHDWPLEGLTDPRRKLPTLLARGRELKGTPGCCPGQSAAHPPARRPCRKALCRGAT